MTHIGTWTDQPTEREPNIICDAPELKRHIDRPWLRAYLAHRLGVSLANPNTNRTGAASIAESDLARHALIVGATGSGKSRLIEHLIGEQLAAGCSAVLIDPKGETAARVLARAQAVGLPPERVTLLDPRLPSGLPGWNPLASDLPLAQAVSDFVAVVQRVHTSWGPRLQDLLTNALLLVGSHGLSVYELARLLVREDYREALLRVPVRPPDPLAYREALLFFSEEFAAWSRSERAQAVSPVLNKLRELLRSPCLRPLLTARRNTLDLGALWRRPGLLIVRLDRAALGEESSRLLAGWLTQLLFRTALRRPGDVPVVLALDELPVLERFVGETLVEIVTIARSQGLRLLVAGQHLAQLSPELRGALLANAAVQVFFRLGAADANLVAASLAAGAEPGAARMLVNAEPPDRQTGFQPHAEWRHPIRDAEGRPLRLNPRRALGLDPIADLYRLARAARVPRLYVTCPMTGAPTEIGRYVAGFHSYCDIDGPRLELIVRFPKPRITGVERLNERDAARAWTASLQDLPVQSAVLRVAGRTPGIVRIADVRTPRLDPDDRRRYAQAALAANGQTRREIKDALAWREAQIEHLARGGALEEDVDDGSLR